MAGPPARRRVAPGRGSTLGTVTHRFGRTGRLPARPRDGRSERRGLHGATANGGVCTEVRRKERRELRLTLDDDIPAVAGRSRYVAVTGRMDLSRVVTDEPEERVGHHVRASETRGRRCPPRRRTRRNSVSAASSSVMCSSTLRHTRPSNSSSAKGISNSDASRRSAAIPSCRSIAVDAFPFRVDVDGRQAVAAPIEIRQVDPRAVADFEHCVEAVGRRATRSPGAAARDRAWQLGAGSSSRWDRPAPSSAPCPSAGGRAASTAPVDRPAWRGTLAPLSNVGTS